MSTPHHAKFTTGSTMRHVIVMTSTSMLGLTFMFLVDAVTFFWVSRLGVEAYLAGLSYAWTLQFFTIAFSVAFMIAASALVARSIGQDHFEQAQEQATSALIITMAALGIVSLVMIIFRDLLLGWVGAEGQALQTASNYLAISLPTMPIMAIGMLGSAILRADGEAWLSTLTTVSVGFVAMIVDPLFIFGFGMGPEGAALGLSVARIVSSAVVFYIIAIKRDMLAPPRLAGVKRWIKPFALIAAPAMLTQMASPTGNVIATEFISSFGDAAVAGWGLLNRILVVAFGGVFALSASIGGIIGQNYGAGKMERVRQAYVDAVIFSTVYVLSVWALLALSNNLLLDLFDASQGAGEVVSSFNYIVAGSFVFAGILYVSNASFNNLGRPLYSTASNWIKDGLLIFPLCYVLSQYFGAIGIIYATGLAWVISGAISGVWGWRFVKRL